MLTFDIWIRFDVFPYMFLPFQCLFTIHCSLDDDGASIKDRSSCKGRIIPLKKLMRLDLWNVLRLG